MAHSGRRRSGDRSERRRAQMACPPSIVALRATPDTSLGLPPSSSLDCGEGEGWVILATRTIGVLSTAVKNCTGGVA